MFIDRIIKLGQNAQKVNTNEILKTIWSEPFVQDFIIDLNTKQQLFLGDLGNGGKMPEGSPSYIASKGNKAAPDGVSTNLFLSGEFYSTFDINILPSGFVIIANTAIYGKDFKDLYGFDILGLNEENLQKLIDFIREDYQAELAKRLLDF